MKTCWAACLGNCSSISREHIVSQSLFIGDLVAVQGYPWCKDEPKTIGLSSLTAKILCERHNNALSPVDTAGAHAFDVFRELQRLANVREKMKQRLWKVVRYEIDGLALERWFLKTLINLSFRGAYPIGDRSLSAGQPAEEIVEIAFGLRRYRGRAGLYFVVHTGQQVHSTDTVGSAPVIKDQAYIEGGLFLFRGFRFLLFLDAAGPPDRLTGLGLSGEDWGESQLNFHNQGIQSRDRGRLSQVITIKW